MRWGPTDAAVEVLVRREGLLAAVGHDLRLAVTRFDVELSDGRDAVRARLEAGSLRVVAAMRDGRDLDGAFSAGDVRKIEQALATEILEAQRFPEITFASTRVTPTPEGLHVEGLLRLHGVERGLSFDAVRRDGGFVAEVSLHQPAFGIAPYRAMLGALRVRADVTLRVRLGG